MGSCDFYCENLSFPGKTQPQKKSGPQISKFLLGDETEVPSVSDLGISRFKSSRLSRETEF